MRFYIKNFGCRLNQHEGDIIAERLIVAGLIPSAMTDADIIVVNGCTVTGRADQKLRQFVHKVQRENKDARILLTGCTATAILKKFLPNINCIEVLDEKWRYSVAEYLFDRPTSGKVDFPDIAGKGIVRARASLKIQDGCDRKCAYCIVPLVRGHSRSRHADDIIIQIANLITSGFTEIILTGVDIGDWRCDGMRLPQLLRKIIDETDVQLIRLSSIEPPGVDDELLSIMSSEHRIAPHLHTPIQSGSADVLRAMHRPKYDIPELLSRLEYLRKKRPELCVGTDIIVGFPGETDSDFQKTVNLLHSGVISYTHLFPFSPRPETDAKHLKRLPTKIVNERTKILRAIDEQNRLRFAQRFIGIELNTVVERCHNGKIYGHSENYLRVIADGTAPRKKIVKILAERAAQMQVYGKIIPK